MSIELRAGRPEDAAACGAICYEAFKTIAGAHNFPQDFPTPDAAVGLMTYLLDHPGFYAVVAEQDGRVIGSNFLDLRGPVAGVGPITIDPAAQNGSIGRRLMADVHAAADRRNVRSVRLCQAAYHGRSLALYTKLDYDVREPLACMQGEPPAVNVSGCDVRPAETADMEDCNQLCVKIHGHDRAGELRDAIAQGTGRVVERAGRITGYATQLAFFGHAVGEENADVMALIGAAESFDGPGFLLPMRNGELFRWCLAQGLRVVQPLTLMSRGFYEEPRGPFLPSIFY